MKDLKKLDKVWGRKIIQLNKLPPKRRPAACKKYFRSQMKNICDLLRKAPSDIDTDAVRDLTEKMHWAAAEMSKLPSHSEYTDYFNNFHKMPHKKFIPKPHKNPAP